MSPTRQKISDWFNDHTLEERKILGLAHNLGQLNALYYEIEKVKSDAKSRVQKINAHIKNIERDVENELAQLTNLDNSKENKDA